MGISGTGPDRTDGSHKPMGCHEDLEHRQSVVMQGQFIHTSILIPKYIFQVSTHHIVIPVKHQYLTVRKEIIHT